MEQVDARRVCKPAPLEASGVAPLRRGFSGVAVASGGFYPELPEIIIPKNRRGPADLVF